MTNDQRRPFWRNPSFWLPIMGLIPAMAAFVVLLLDRGHRETTQLPPPPPQPAAPPELQEQPAAQPLEQVLPQRVERDQAINWDVVGLASAAFTIAAAGIFFFAGWIYEAHWYGFYGIDLSQINLVPAAVMIQGVPGIVLLTIIMFAAATLVGLRARRDRPIKGASMESLPGMIVSAFVISSVVLGVLVVISIVLIGPSVLTVEVSTTLVVAALIFIAAYVTLAFPNLPFMTPSAEFFDIPIPRQIARSRLVRQSYQQRQWSQMLKVWLMPFCSTDTELVKTLDNLTEHVTQELKTQRNLVVTDIQHSWRYWLGIILVLLLLVSTAASSLLGEVDARRGARFLNGNRQLTATFVSTERAIPVLEHYRIETSVKRNNLYGPFFLISQNSDTMFLSDTKDARFFEQRPNVYYLSRSGHAVDLYQPLPTPAPSGTPIVP